MCAKLTTPAVMLATVLAIASAGSSLWNRFPLYRPDRFGGEVSYIKVSPDDGGGPPMAKNSWFGYSISRLGDLNEDGVEDLLVGAYGESYYSAYSATVSKAAGAAYILFMTKNFTVQSYTRLSGERKVISEAPAVSLVNNANFGFSVANVGDLDGDGVTDIAVGAPGTYVGAVYIIFLHRNGTMKRDPVMIREGHGNGPPQTYQGRFGSTVATIGDFDGDGIPDLAATAGDAAAGSSKLYILLMLRDGTVRSYSIIGFGVGGGPAFENQFTNFGSSIVSLGDLDRDNVTDIAIGARFNTDPGGEESSGGIYICFMHANGTIKSFVKHGDVVGTPLLPAFEGDECGGGLANIGDLNKDDYNYRRPEERTSGNPPMPDLAIGCSQGRTGFDGGRFMIGFLEGLEKTQKATGNFKKYREYEFTKSWMPSLSAGDQFGQSVSGYTDADGNEILDFIIGAPGDDVDRFNNLTDTGAIYLMFVEREEYVWPVVDLTVFYILVTVLPGCCCICCVAAIVAFMYTFRHKEDEVEKLAKEVGMSSIKLGESTKMRRTSSKVAPGADEQKDGGVDVEEGLAGDRPDSAKSDRPDSVKSASKKSSKKSGKNPNALVYHRQKTSLQTYSKKIDDFDDDEHVDEYF